MDDLVSAAEALLRDKPFDAISVGEICRAAGLTTGAFYARFPSKEALMPLLYERFQEWLATVGPPRFARVKWERLPLEKACEEIARILVELCEERTWLLRAATLFARTRTGDWPRASTAARNVVLDGMTLALTPHLKTESGDALRFVVFATMSAVREAVLFGYAPMAAAGVRRARLARDIGRLICGYLTQAGVIKRRRA